MNYRVSRHAQQTIRERNIPETAIDTVLNSPQQIVDGKDGKRVYQSVFKVYDRQFLVRVIVNDDHDPVEVITVYKTSQIDKYWEVTVSESGGGNE